MSLPRSLASIVPMLPSGIGESEIHLPLFDYFDSWEGSPTPQGEKEVSLAESAVVLAHDLVNAAVYSHLVQNCRDRAKEGGLQGPAVVVALTLIEGFLVSFRCACDALATGIAVAACDKPKQAPGDSLRKLVEWAKKNEARVHPKLRPILLSDIDWFWRLRSLRDSLIHQGRHANVFWNGDEFLLILSPFKVGQPMPPLFSLMASVSENFLEFAYRSTEAVQEIIELPPERRRSRVLHCPFVPALKGLRSYCPSPPDPAHYWGEA
jgi:hypothetical protein